MDCLVKLHQPQIFFLVNRISANDRYIHKVYDPRGKFFSYESALSSDLPQSLLNTNNFHGYIWSRIIPGNTVGTINYFQEAQVHNIIRKVYHNFDLQDIREARINNSSKLMVISWDPGEVCPIHRQCATTHGHDPHL